MDSKEIYQVIGLMSGTSLDGLDLVYCRFTHTSKGWAYTIQDADTATYAKEWTENLRNAHQLSAENFVDVHVRYGRQLGRMVNAFIKKKKIKKVDFIASHGHTVFHQPHKGFTFQIGDGQALYAETGIPVIYDFRSLDVYHGGQGAPLVPVGDRLLFHEYDICLNLGGIANLSMEKGRKRIAYDICFVNMGLNHLASKVGLPYDKDGQLSEMGEIHAPSLKSLDQVYAGYRKKHPSLGREMFEAQIRPILDNEALPLNDRLRTFTESAAREIALAIILLGKKKANVLCTGGGAFNSFLLYRIMENLGDKAQLVRPEDEVVNFKEALVFAFLGVLRARGEVNSLRSVTGALLDTSSGLIAEG